MRKMLIVSFLGLITAGTSGCVNCGNPCGSWRPGSLFSSQRPAQSQVCCDPCAPTAGYAPIAAPVAVAAPCCQ